MAEFQFESLSAESVAKDLMTKADGEDGLLPKQLGNFLVNVVERGGVSGTVGEEDAIGIHGEDVARRCFGMNDLDAEAILTETAKDVAFDAEVIGDDVVFHWRQ